VHRRVAGAQERGELRALREELADRFGLLPEPVENLLELQRARIELGRAGARTVEIRGGRLAAAPVELEAAEADALRERLPQADYDFRSRTVSVRVPPEPGARLAGTLALAEALAAARATPVAA
jgi:transcription-repair coupling factor (superfamily II helicase)